MSMLPTAILRPGEADRVVAGHPWIYAGALARLTEPADDGAVVQVKDHRQRFLGVGLHNARSKIRVRMLSTEREEIDQPFFERRIAEALEVRRRLLPDATSYRVVNAESDFLSGLIVDRYEDVLALQISALGMEQRKPAILAALNRIFNPRAIVERNDVASRRFEGLAEFKQVTQGELEGPLVISMNQIRFEADLLGGHKTGAYLDQQVNYQEVARLAGGGDVLDAFSFAGGFALHAARAGARRVLGLDQSESATQAARRHAEMNGLADRCSFETTNVFDWMKSRTTARPNERAIPVFDLVVLDPPSFTRNRASVPDAMRGYKEIHLRALKLLKVGGRLATFCCSHHIDAPLFLEVILDAARDARKTLRRAAVYHQAPDHPVLPAIPETEYLKGFAFEVVR